VKKRLAAFAGMVRRLVGRSVGCVPHEDYDEAMRRLRDVVGNRIALWSYGGHEGELHRKMEDDKHAKMVRETYEWLQSPNVKGERHE
jgi:hypothetical protein